MQFGVDTYDLVSKYISDGNGNDKSWQDILDLLDQAGLVIIAVNTLPTASADTMGAIYLVPNSGTAPNVKDEYITVRSGTDPNFTYAWELIGTTEVDLSNYVQKGTYSSSAGSSHTHTATVDIAPYSASTQKLSVSRTTDAALSTTNETVLTGLGTASTDTVLGTDATFSVSGGTASTSKLVTDTASYVTVSAGSAASWSASVDANGVLSFSWSANTPTSVSASNVTVATGSLDANGSGASVATGVSAISVSVNNADTVTAVTGYASPTTESVIKTVSVGTQPEVTLNGNDSSGIDYVTGISAGTPVSTSVTVSSEGAHTHDTTL